MENYLYRGNCVATLKSIPPDRFFRARLNMDFAGHNCHPGLNDLKREAAALGGQHFQISFWEDLPTSLARYPFSVSPSALLRFRVEDLRERGFRLSPDEHTGEGGVVASVVDCATPSENFPDKHSCTGIPLASIDVLCPDMNWRSLDTSGILDDRDIFASAHRFDIQLREARAWGHAWCFEKSKVVYVHQHWTGGCYLTGHESRALFAAMEVSRALGLRQLEQYRWIFEVERTEPARFASEAHLERATRTLRQIFSGSAPQHTLEFALQLRGERDVWLEELDQTAITSGQWRWLHPVRKAAAQLRIRDGAHVP
ncbi:hypothetical protein [Aquimonas sp.]|uniref:hypothetical protein n=1 Tax=Aquimonas sp. TaxID=1872588 RepID=UPI0037C04CD2